ncbi:MAG: GreA/GreB family elongation factor [Chthoniobacterales bacterium]|nr:GreA/GreB family elongation factor [Chthoniobacterales bacterium]
MTDELTNLIEAGKINEATAEKLLQLSPGAYCKHRSWGLGRIAEWQLSTEQVLIDFHNKKGHPMQLEYAAETLVYIPEEHILAKIAANAEAIREEAKKDPVELMRSLLQDHGGAGTVEEIAAILVPAVFDVPSFKKWFEVTKKKLKADGHFHIPAKKTAPIELQETKTEPHERLLEQFRLARHPKEQVAALDALLKVLQHDTLTPEELQELARELEEAAQRGERSHTTKALELLLLRSEMAKFHQPLGLASDAIAALLNNAAASKKLPTILKELPPVKYRRVLELFPTVFSDHWEEHARQLLRYAEPRLINEIFHLFTREKSRDRFGSILARLIQERSASSDLLSWICEERATAFPELVNSDLLSAILSSLERDSHGEGKKGARLQELIFKDRELIADLLKSANSDTARDIIRKIMISPVFSDLDRRSFLARILKVYPELESLVTGHQEKEATPARDENLIVSWASLERRKKEYEHLVSKLIPQNTSDIAIARSYGDLRENLEFKAAKEQQAMLLRQKSELEIMLNHTRGTNFENPDTSAVSIGTIVTLKDKATGEQEIYSILGAWDGAPEKRWISYQTVIGQTLLGHRVGETILLPHEKENRAMVIEKIEPFVESVEVES